MSKLIDKAHGKGMKVFFDVITNHTAAPSTTPRRRAGTSRRAPTRTSTRRWALRPPSPPSP
ncbi:alpha-amylase family glycosyl hydrolase [Streptomyces sp. NBC_00057]|uniref:alpha-amylase family glycosyl hydrolase n=1 Tax=Streptomyces sp. NBC_00057 TaxID=2975634 RepID=UPI003866B636